MNLTPLCPTCGAASPHYPQMTCSSLNRLFFRIWFHKHKFNVLTRPPGFLNLPPDSRLETLPATPTSRELQLTSMCQISQHTFRNVQSTGWQVRPSWSVMFMQIVTAMVLHTCTSCSQLPVAEENQPHDEAKLKRTCCIIVDAGLHTGHTY